MALENLCMGCMNDKGANTVCPVCGYAEGTAPASPFFLPPRTILNGRYIIGRVLGDGGFGITYLAWDRLEERKAAIKEYFPEGIVTRSPGLPGVSVYSGSKGEFFRDGLDKFLTEAKALRRFKDHAGIVSVYDFFHGNNTAYIVMEYLEGKTLTDYLAGRGGKIPFEEAINVLADIFAALGEVHKSRMLHRDIKPDNIFVLKDGKRAVLIDFGAARQFVGQRSKSLSAIVTDGYSPFEQYQEDGEQGAWTDVYALGATLYRMLSGERPPQATSRIVQDKLVPLAAKGIYLPPQADAAIGKALAVPAQARHQSVAEFWRALAEKYSEKTERCPYAGTPEIPSVAQETGGTRNSQSDGPLRKSFPVRKVLLGVSLVLFVLLTFAVWIHVSNGAAVENAMKRGKDYADKGLYDEAIGEYDKAIKLAPKRADAYCERGDTYLKKHLYDAALADCSKAIELDPKNAKAYSSRGCAYGNKGLSDAAMADCSKALELDPKCAMAYVVRGYYYYFQKELYDIALTDFNKALELDPKCDDAYFTRGEVSFQKGKYDEAIADYNKALELSPKFAGVYTARGNAYFQKGLYDKALTDFNKALELDRNDAYAYYGRGYVYGAKGLYDKSIADFTKVIELLPNDAEAYYARADVYEAKGLYDKAEADYDKANKLQSKKAGT